MTSVTLLLLLIAQDPNAYPMKTVSAKNPKTAVTFEQTLAELEQIVICLETGNMPLETALGQFEQGVRLLKKSQQQLKQAEQRVHILLNDDAQALLEPFNPGQI